MRTPKVCLVPVLVAILTIAATGQGQSTDPQFGTAGINAIDADPRPCGSAGRLSPSMGHDSANDQGSKPPNTRATRTITGGNRGIPAIAADPRPMVFIPSSTQAKPLSRRYMGFETFFMMIGVNAKYAADYERIGKFKKAESYRTEFQRDAGLSDAEGEVLQEVAHDCICALREQDAKLKAYNEKFPVRYVPGTTITTPPEFVQMFEYRKTIVIDHVEKLRQGLGDTAFQKLETKVMPMFILPEPSRKTPVPPTAGESTTETKQH
jgi:hypothetical protein